MKEPIPLPLWKFIRALAPAVAIWLALVALLGYLLIDRTDQGAESDEASIREWIDEERPFRKTLPELVRELLQRVEENGDVASKKEELSVQLRAMVDPVRLYQGQLPVFPEFYRLEVRFLKHEESLVTISWDSTVPRPKIKSRTHVRSLDHVILGPDGQPGAVVRCEYRMHAFNKLQRDEAMRQRAYLYEIKLDRYRTLRPTCSSKDKLEFEFVSSYFARLLDGKIFREVVQIDCVIYEAQSPVVQKYEALKRHFWNSGKAKTEILVFHGTDSAAIQRIISGGFKVGGTRGIPVRNGSSYGRGIYTSSEPEAAIQFGKKSGQVILAKVTSIHIV